MTDSTSLTPVLFIPHGGGPLPLIDDPAHASLSRFLGAAAQYCPDPDAIVVFSAHWEEDVAVIGSHPNPALIYDYYGFPEETYRIEYPAPGAPDLCDEITTLLERTGIESRQDSERGFDHGLFVPLKMMYPQANIPCVQVSLLKSLDAAAHIEIGRALAPLREKNILLLGSGMSFHNLRTLMRPESETHTLSVEFDDWLRETCCDEHLQSAERTQRLINWKEAPAAAYSHPREEHLLPLHMCFGAATKTTTPARLIYNDQLMSAQVSALLWQ
ncbi:MAG: class III extradiol ring-cleavage dioxygenase [Pseudomonadota bacterium]